MNTTDVSESDHIWLQKVPNQSSFGTINGVLGGVLNLVTFPSRGDQRTSKSTEQVKICMIQKKSWLYGRFQRKLINESLDTFLSIQRAASDPDKDFKPLLIKKSKEYRSMIQACVSEMNSLARDLENGKAVPFKEDLEYLKVNSDLLYKMELLLGLIEIIFLDVEPGGYVLNHLLNWIRLHFPKCRQRMSEALSLEQPVSYEYYWETVYGLIFQGLLEEARDMLSSHPNSNMDSFLSMDELLRKMPVYTVYSGVSESEFKVRWMHWQSECESRLQKGEFIHCNQLETLCKILCGDVETMLSLSDVLDAWYHYMVSHLLFTNPTVKLHRLACAAQDAVIGFGEDLQLNYLDILVLAILEMNDRMMMKHFQSILDNLWFTTHVVDILYHASEKNSEKEYLKNMRESLCIDYGSELVSHKSLWQIGMVYLDTSGTACSIPFAEAVLERIPLTNDEKACKVIQAATERSFDNVAMNVCRVMGRKMFQEGQLGSAIWWGVRSQDAAFTSHLAHKILQKYMEDGEFLSSTLLDHLGPSMLLSDTLTFLGKYREFHMLYQEGNLKSAASLLVSLIASRLAPEYFWPVLLEDALPLLQSPEPVISTDQTYKLIYCLHNLSITSDDSTSVKEKKKKLYSSFFDKEAEVRVALTNNLARAIIQEGTVDYNY